MGDAPGKSRADTCAIGAFPFAATPAATPSDQETVMKSMKFAALLLALSAASPAFAEQYTSLKALSEQTGLSVRHVNMVLGNRSAFAEYPYTYDRALKRFQAAIGVDNYERLMAGKAIRLDNGLVVTRTDIVVGERQG